MKTFKQFWEGKTQLYGLSIKELLDTVLNFNGKTLIYFDTETMGLAPKKDYLQLTEIAAVAYDGTTFKEVDKLDYKVSLLQVTKDVLKRGVKFKEQYEKDIVYMQKRKVGQKHITEHTFFPEKPIDTRWYRWYRRENR